MSRGMLEASTLLRDSMVALAVGKEAHVVAILLDLISNVDGITVEVLVADVTMDAGMAREGEELMEVCFPSVIHLPTFRRGGNRMVFVNVSIIHD
jgi:hypothetical protein